MAATTSPIGTARAPAPDAAARTPTVVLRVVLGAAIVSSIAHYTDNYVRFDQYPPAGDGFVTRPLIWQSWLLFTVLGLVGYLLYRRGALVAAAACLLVYSVSGLISPLHYREGPLSEFDAVQHTFIITDLLAGLAVVAFAVWLLTRTRTAGGGR